MHLTDSLQAINECPTMKNGSKFDTTHLTLINRIICACSYLNDL